MDQQPKPIKRRGPHSRLPEELAQHGYVRDLVAEISIAAASMGAKIHFHTKNADWYIAVLIPRQAELDAIDAATEDESRIKE